jgi:hypothetical protein
MESTLHENIDWFVRIDDQSMYPSYLVDESEIKYQKWFAQRYPEVERVRSNKEYLNSSFRKFIDLRISFDSLFGSVTASHVHRNILRVLISSVPS